MVVAFLIFIGMVLDIQFKILVALSFAVLQPKVMKSWVTDDSFFDYLKVIWS